MQLPANSVRVAKMIAFSGMIALVAACSETTAPTPTSATTTPVATPAPAAMVSVAGSIDDMTQWYMQSFDDATTQGKFQDILTGLKGHLISGNVLACQQDVTSAWGVLSSLSDVQQVETGPLGVALDVVQKTLDGVSQ